MDSGKTEAFESLPKLRFGSRASRLAFVFGIALLLVIADQGSKYLAVRDLTGLFERASLLSLAERIQGFYGESQIEHLASGGAVFIRGLWRHHYTENPGAAFSLFDQAPALFRMIFFALTFLIATAFVSILALRREAAHPIRLVALGAILGGASGNFIDRLAHRYVIDFVDLLYTMPRWLNLATFNVADVGITLGSLVFILTLFREARLR